MTPILGIIASSIQKVFTRLFISSSTGTVLSTQDGATYTTVIPADGLSSPINDISKNTITGTIGGITGTVYTAVGNNNRFYTSTNSTTWTTGNPGLSGNNINAGVVAQASYGPVAIASSTGPITRVSSDLSSWTTIMVNNPSYASFYMGGRTVAVENNNNQIVIANENGGILKSGSTFNSFDAVSINELSFISQNSTFGNTVITSIAYGNSLWVAGGVRGQIRTSTDAITWTTRNLTFGGSFAGDANKASVTSIAQGNNLWVAVGAYGNLSTSPDGITWTTRTSNFDPYAAITSVAYGNSLWVAGGGYGQLRTSTNGTTWTTKTSNFGNTGITSIAYGNSLWLVAGRTGQLRGSMTTIPSYSNIKSVKKMGSTMFGLIADNKYYQTSDFITYTEPALSNLGTPVSLDHNVVAGSNGYIYNYNQSNNTYTEINTHLSSRLEEVSKKDDQYAVFVNGITPVSWTTATSNITEPIYSIAQGNNLWVAGGASGQIRTSTNGTTWTTRTSNFGNTNVQSIAYGNSLWVAVGRTGQLRTSTDAITWTTQTSNFGNSIIFGVAYGNNLWVATGQNGQLRTSTDAISWTTRISTIPGDITSVAYGNNLWVIGGQNTQLRTSTDGVAWTTRASNFTPAWAQVNSIAYGNNLWVAGGYYGQLSTSTDAVTWTTRTSNFGNTFIYSVAYGNNLWVAGGYSGQIRTSIDGITWTTQTSNFQTTNIRSVAYGNNLWVAGGASGQIRTSTVSSRYGVYTSEDGVTWSTTPLTLPIDNSQANDIELL